MKGQWIKRALAGALAIILLAALPMATPAKAAADTHFTYWLMQGEDSSFYKTYEENPAIRYMTDNLTFGPENKQISLEFLVPVKGSEKDNFNTLLATEEYADIMDMAAYTGSIVELYEDGIILDLTEYVNLYMPNYRAFLDANPDVALYATNLVNGEKKYLQLFGCRDSNAHNWYGFEYRRDWIIKYGVNPFDGSAFSGAYTEVMADGTVDKDSWDDNVVFPSGNPDPVYISDWEWMLDIFATAIEAQGIKDGYCMSIPYNGYAGTNDLVGSFGGGGAQWYKNKDNKIVFGAETDDFRVYLQCMYTWYQNGWIDKAFPEHSSDMFYRIDEAKVRQGKVGLWIGIVSQLEGKLDDGEGFKDGMVAYAARQPINDIYGTEAQQHKEPYAMYLQSRIGTGTTISAKAKDKDLATLFSFLDYQYTQDGANLHMLGLSKEQYEQTQDEFYTRYGLTEGAYYGVETEKGIIYEPVDAVQYDTGTLRNACKALRIFGLDAVSTYRERGAASLMNNLDQWVWFDNPGYLEGAFILQLSADDSKAYNKIYNNVLEFLAKNLPNFIKGSKDPFNDDDWNAFVKALNKYNPAKATGLFQDLLDLLK